MTPVALLVPLSVRPHCESGVDDVACLRGCLPAFLPSQGCRAGRRARRGGRRRYSLFQIADVTVSPPSVRLYFSHGATRAQKRASKGSTFEKCRRKSEGARSPDPALSARLRQLATPPARAMPACRTEGRARTGGRTQAGGGGVLSACTGTNPPLLPPPPPPGVGERGGARAQAEKDKEYCRRRER